MAFNFSPKVVTDGLVLYLDAANSKSIVSGSTTWNDLSRNGNNGTLINGPTFNSSNGGSIVFDGTNDYVGVTNSIPQILNKSSVTYCAWVKWNGNNLFGAIMGNEVFRQTNGFGIRRRGTNVYGISSGLDLTFIVFTDTLSLIEYSNWHYVVGVLTGTEALIYINGSIRGQANFSNTITSTAPFRIGAVDYLPNFDYFNGSISSAKVYNRALSAQEILQNYNTTKTRFGL